MDTFNENLPEPKDVTFLIGSGISSLNRDYPEVVDAMRFMINDIGADITIAGSPHSNQLYFKYQSNYNNQLAAPAFPQDYIVTTSNTIFIHPKRQNLLQTIDIKGRDIIIDPKYCEGGRYAFGDKYIFFGIDEDIDMQALEHSFEEQTLIQIPTPEAVGIPITQSMVRTHIDQFLGGTLVLKDGNVIAPIHSEYYDGLQSINYVRNNGVMLLPIGGEYLNHYIFNYPRTPWGTFYVDPLLMVALGKIYDIHLEDFASDIVCLPESLPMATDGAGLKCRVNFVF